MKSLVVYDSKFGNTEKIAKAIGSALSKSGNVNVVNVEKAGITDIEKVDILIVGSPTQAWSPTPATKSFLESIHAPLHSMPVAAFDTRFNRTRLLTGSAARKIAKALKKKGSTLLAEPESFFVTGMEGPLLEGEIERAKNWAKELAKKPQ
ncbi:MAG: flavodoxin domain-containing protein [Candidatus Aenigmarchaeota archaeon]|nr:flavodoxin domain-containing protein [Candidatus Aenigmarchaeota archaeon]